MPYCSKAARTTAERLAGDIRRVLPDASAHVEALPSDAGVWAERCMGCGNCLLGETGGICPIARCAKQLMNGPCGGSTSGHCEIGDEVDCAWALIWERLKELGQQDRYVEIAPAKDWRAGKGAGPRKIIREDLAE